MDIRTEREKKSYEKSAVKYNHVDEIRRFKWYGAKLEDMEKFDMDIVDMIPEHCKVLEVGCGSGRLAKKIFENRDDVKYVGIDIVEDNIKSCHDLNLAGFKFKVMNYWNALVEEHFNFVISEGVLFSTTDKKYTELLFDLLNSKATKGFFVMAIVLPELGIPKEIMESKMAKAIENSNGIEEYYFKGKREKLSKIPVQLNRVFYLVRKSQAEIIEVNVPAELL
jgi:cyclopropane fatty-acyl-phospholipid synthase-like methyltransferase